MSRSFMPIPHQAAEPHCACPWAWELAEREARTLQPQPFARWLRVDSGQVWLTRTDGSEPASDIWLDAGQSLSLPAGSTWVLEAWPRARMSLLVPSPARPAPGHQLATALATLRASWLAASTRPLAS